MDKVVGCVECIPHGHAIKSSFVLISITTVGSNDIEAALRFYSTSMFSNPVRKLSANWSLRALID